MAIDRRTFLKRTAAGAALFTIIPRKVLGKMGGNNNFVAPNDQLTRGLIGTGNIGLSGQHFISDERCRLVALCDVDSKHLENGMNKAKRQFNETPASYHDFRDLVHDKNVDIVHIATPSHWHALMSIEAARAGKDIFCEKPMTRTIGEGKRVEEAVKLNARVFRLDTWFRFKDTFYGMGTDVKPLKKIVESGVLGWPLTVRISCNNGFHWNMFGLGLKSYEEQPIPKELDYDLWLGPAPYKPYHVHRTHGSFRYYWDYDGGGLADMGQHYLDPTQYMLGKDDTFPVRVDIDAPQQHPDAVGTWRQVTFTYEDGCKIILEGEGSASSDRVPFLEGPNGKVYQGLESTIPNLREIINEWPDPEPQNVDFLDCVRNRRQFALNETNGHHSCTIVNLAVCAWRLNRTLYFDPKTQTFINDDAANRLIDQPMRGEWAKII